ncbi:MULTISPECIES: hypothetical protein [unclassified Brevundimonas]|uniref:hypothetical protein n=1 Tax=unclassified Brevundimonas TaxID=2622653 RepID=UPI0025B8B372|nr:MULTISPECIES: hypothetical protein [unclassified Brevundimonas]
MSEGDNNGFPWAADTKGSEEVRLWGNDEALQGMKRRNHGRLLWLWGWIVPALMIMFTLLFVGSIMAWGIHYLTPWKWLSSEQLAKIQSVIFSGSLGALVTSYVQKHVFGDAKS